MKHAVGCSCHHSVERHDKNGLCFSPGCMCKSTTVSVVDESDVDLMSKIKSLRLSRSPAIVNKNRKCYFCGDIAETIDHLVPRARGGKNHPSNKVYACAFCNGMKSSMTTQEFILFCKDKHNEALDPTTSKRRTLLFRLIKAKANLILAHHKIRVAGKEKKQSAKDVQKKPVAKASQNTTTEPLPKEPEYIAKNNDNRVYNPDRTADVVFTRCLGLAGLCTQNKNLDTCRKCRKPYCRDHMTEHPKYCLGLS